MIFLKRRRLLFWLIRAYAKKWKNTFLLFFGLGLLTFFILYFASTLLRPLFPFKTHEVVGIVGSYTLNNLPSPVLEKLSYGLTAISEEGIPQPFVSSSWKIKDDGKTYEFTIKKDFHFTDGQLLTSDKINYNFENVNIKRPSKDTIIFRLKDSYSPFLITVTRPILKKNLVGLGQYKVKAIDLNGEFVDSIALMPLKKEKNITYQFYPTENALKTALILGEIGKTEDISDLSYSKTSLTSFANLSIKAQINYEKLATLFYNSQDSLLSDKRLREALTYALPNNFSQGKRTRTPYPPTHWASFENAFSFDQDFDHAKLLFSESQASGSATIKINIKTLPKYKKSAEEIQKSWKVLGVAGNVEVVDSLPSNFRVFLGEFNVSKDPDQYALWHSSEPNNITGYRNLRIDKLLEDGRKTVDLDLRKKIYADFQKYILDDPPAAFLFFPYNYSISKK